MADKISLQTVASLQNETTVLAAINNNITATEVAIDNSLSRDGTNPNEMNAILDMNSNRIVNLPAPIFMSEPLRVADLGLTLSISIEAGGIALDPNAAISWNSGNAAITQNDGADTLVFTGAANGYRFDAPLLPNTNDGAALGSGTLKWSDLYLASGAVISWNNGAITLTDTSGALTLSGASSVKIGTNITPVVNDGGALGTGTLKWSDLFLATDAVIDWGNGQMNIVQNSAADSLGFAGATGGYRFDAGVVPSANAAASLGNPALGWSALHLSTDSPINWANGLGTITHASASDSLGFAGFTGGYRFDAPVQPSANDGAALGAAATSWSDLFLASGAIINFANGNFTATHSSGALTFGGAIAASNLLSGTYVPTVTLVTNVAAATAATAQYIRVGSVVHVSGKINIDLTAGGAAEVALSIPVVSDFSGTENCAGSGCAGLVGIPVDVRADVTNNRASFNLNTANTAANDYFYSYTYVIV